MCVSFPGLFGFLFRWSCLFVQQIRQCGETSRFDLRRYRTILNLWVVVCGMWMVDGVHANDRHGAASATNMRSLASFLSDDDLRRYRRVFALQKTGRFAEADRHLSAVKDDLLMGHVLMQRYLSPHSGRISFKTLKAWLHQYADLPGAWRIYRLARRRGSGALPTPTTGLGVAPSSLGEDPRWEHEAIMPVSRGRASVKAWRRLRRSLAVNAFTKAEKILGTRGILSVDRARMRAFIAHTAFIRGRDRLAIEHAQHLTSPGPMAASLAYWAAGLASWRQKDFAGAERWFSALQSYSDISPWLQSAVAYWSARVALRLRRPHEVEPHLVRAAVYPRTFYGLMARQALGLPPGFDWQIHELTEEEAAAVMRFPSGKRALALALVGEVVRAEEELRYLYPAVSPHQQMAILRFADQVGLAGLALRLSSNRSYGVDSTFDTARYPVPLWYPHSGWTLDRAMIYAFVRQESAFKADARSPAGAVGLMQMMPATARSVVRMERRGWLKNARAVMDPGVSLSLGQRYISHLLERPGIDGNLFFVAVAYNAGPGNLARWRKRTHHHGDPLLFIEAIPSRETRSYVERVMADMWIYRDRLGQESPGLGQVARGQWPVYSPQDGVVKQTAMVR